MAEAPKRRWWNTLSTIVVLGGSLLGGMTLAIQNGETVAAFARDRCIALTLCGPGERFVKVSIATLDPSDAAAQALSPRRDEDGRGEDAADVLARYGLDVVREDGNTRLALSLANGVTGRHLPDGTPYQIARTVAYWMPESFRNAWPLGYPILDLIVAETGEAIDIAFARITVERAEADLTPYVQLVAPSDEFASVLALPEGPDGPIEINLTFNIAADPDLVPFCDQLPADALMAQAFEHELAGTTIEGPTAIDLTPYLARELPGWRYEERRHRRTPGPANAPASFEPPTAAVRGRSNPWPDAEAVRVVYGRLQSRSANGTFESAFCAEVAVEPPDGLGGGPIGFDDTDTVRLRVQNDPYVIQMPVNYRLDGDEQHFRTALMFSSERSASFDLRIEFVFGDRVLYRSDAIGLRTFVPRATMEHMDPQL